ncbi:putative ABC transporter permease [Paenibacillus sp. HN-1]|nr:putative ABC transporter permease [Paenibacillus sp. CGMCC 1.18879]MBY9082947.1 putative ABC transporter permease [Paenibacillus sinensis]
MIYSVLGWLLEGTYNRVTTGTFRKDGLMLGPYKPMYGLAPVLLLALGGLRMPLPWLLVSTLIVPTVVEFASGAMLKALFRRQWWDYSGKRWQLGGHICLEFSLYWWVLSLFTLAVIQPLVSILYWLVLPAWGVLFPVVLVLFAADLAATIRSRRRAAAVAEI